MNISWYGHSCFKLDFKVGNEDVSVIVDPFSSDIGYELPTLGADLLLLTNRSDAAKKLKSIDFKDKKNEILIDSPGEYEAKSVFVQAVPRSRELKEGEERSENIIYRIQGERISLAHLGDLNGDLSSEQLDVVENVDILLIPVGGKDTINAGQAVKIMNQIEPKIVIPMHYNLPKLKTELDGLDKFLHEMGMSEHSEEGSLKINASNLTNENIIVKILKPLVK